MNEQIAEWFDVCELVPWEDNPRNNDQAVDEIANSIKRFGWTNPILARLDDKMVIAGHTRLKAAVALGMNRVPVRFLDVDPVQARLIAIADNKLGERADWNDELLSQVLSDFSDEDLFGLGFDDDELDRLLGEDTDTFDVDEDTPEVEDVVHSVLGEVYQLGPHRLMCGDCTNKDNWSVLMESTKGYLLVTDPPYGVDYDGVHNDDRAGLEDLLDGSFKLANDYLINGSSIYCFHSDKCADIFHKTFRTHFYFSSILVWAKSSLVLSQSDYHSQHEPCIYGWTNGAAHRWYSDRKQTSLMNFDKPHTNADHPTSKPLDLICYLIGNSSKSGEVVIDMFGGSGSTLIASALKNRVCYTMEISPAYCDVIRRRWTQYANDNGLEPGDGAL